MKKLILFILLFILLCFAWAGSAWGADKICYVASSGSTPTSPYDTPETAATLPSTCVAYVKTQTPTTGHIIYIKSGNYSGNIPLDLDSDMNNATIIGVKDLTTLTPANKGEVLLTSTDNIIRNRNAGVTIKNITGTGTTTSTGGIYNTTEAGLLTLENIYIYDTYRLFFVLGGSVIMENSKLLGHTGTTGSVYAFTMGGSGDLTMDGNIIGNSVNNNNGISTTTSFMRLNNTGTNILRNNYITGSYGKTINQDGAATTSLFNNFIGGSWTNNEYTIYRSAGTITAQNNMIMRSFGTNDYIAYDVTLDESNIITRNPRITTHQRSGIIVFCQDDTNGLEDGYDFAVFDALHAKGIHTTVFFNRTILSTYLAGTLSRIALGLDIAEHGRTHTAWTQTGKIWDISKGAETATIDRTANTITLSGGGAITGFKTKLLSAIQTELEGFGWTVTPTAIYETSGTAVQDYLTGESLASGTATTEFNLKTDDLTGQSGFYKDEIADHMSYFQDTLGITPTVAGGPGGYTSDDVQTVIQNLGFDSLRSYKAQTDSETLLKNIDLYETSVIDLIYYITGSGSATKDEIEARTRAVAEFVLESGSLIYLLSHSAEQASVQQLEWIADILINEYPEIQIMSASEAVDYIKTSGTWTTADNRTYSRTWTDNMDLTPLEDSWLINNGYDDCATLVDSTDYDGLITCKDSLPTGNWRTSPLTGRTGVDVGPHSKHEDDRDMTVVVE